MHRAGQGTRRVFGGLLMVGVAVCFAAVASPTSTPSQDVEEGGVFEAPTHEQDALRREEQRQEQGGHR